VAAGRTKLPPAASRPQTSADTVGGEGATFDSIPYLLQLAQETNPIVIIKFTNLTLMPVVVSKDPGFRYNLQSQSLIHDYLPVTLEKQSPSPSPSLQLKMRRKGRREPSPMFAAANAVRWEYAAPHISSPPDLGIEYLDQRMHYLQELEGVSAEATYLPTYPPYSTDPHHQ